MSTAALVKIGELAVRAHQAHEAFCNGRSGGRWYRGPDELQALLARKGETERLLRVVVKQYLGEE
jgi:hypothetical protein